MVIFTLDELGNDSENVFVFVVVADVDRKLSNYRINLEKFDKQTQKLLILRINLSSISSKSNDDINTSVEVVLGQLIVSTG